MVALKKHGSRIDFDGVDEIIEQRINAKYDNAMATKHTSELIMQHSESSMMRKKAAYKSSNNVAFLDTAVTNAELAV